METCVLRTTEEKVRVSEKAKWSEEREVSITDTETSERISVNMFCMFSAFCVSQF